MTGINSRENPRSSKSAESAFATSQSTAARGKRVLSNPAAPVLFRLPSISGSPGAVAALSGHSPLASSMAMPVGAAPLANSPTPMATPQPPAPLAALTMESANSSLAAASRGIGHRVTQMLLVVLLLVAIAILSTIALRPHFAVPELAGDQSEPDLAPLVVIPEATDSPAVIAAKNGGETAGAVNSSAADGLLSGLEINEPAKPVTSRAQVQLGLPIPVKQTSKDLATNAAGDSLGSQSLPLSTPRYETVSSPSSASEAPASSSGASPSLWDGAEKLKHSAGSAAESDGQAQLPNSLAGKGSIEPALPWPVPAESSSTSTATSAVAGQQPKLKLPELNTNSAPAAPALLDAAKLTGQLSSQTQGSGSGVTVGGQLNQAGTLAKTTATPDLDAAAISKKYLDYIQRKSVSNSSGTAAPVLASPTPTTSLPAVGTPNAMTSATVNSAAQPSATVTPYVRSAPSNSMTPATSAQSATSAQTTWPSASPTMPTSQPASSSAPMGLIGQTGYATVPTGDLAAPIPVMGRVGSGSAPPPTGIQSSSDNSSGLLGKP